MNLNKKIVKTMVFALGLGMLSFAGVSQAKASGGAPAFNNGTGIFTAKTSTKFWAVAKPVKDAKKANITVDGTKHYVIKASDIEVYNAGINVSGFADGKNVLIAYGPKDVLEDGKYKNWEVHEIKASNAKFKVFYLGSANGKLSKAPAKHALGKDYGYIAVEVSDGKKVKELELATDHTKLEVKSGDGAWKKFAEFFGGNDATKVDAKLKALVQRGAILTFRYKEDNAWFKEAKLKIPAQPKAPRVGVDTKKDLITSLKKGMEYQIVEKTGTDDVAPVDNKWKDIEDKVKVLKFSEVKDAPINPSKNYILYVRNKADKKKILSKMTKISLKKSEDLTMNQAAVDGSEGYIVGAEATQKIKIALVRKFDTTKGAIVTNTTTDDYEVFVDGGTNDTLPEKAKWTLLKGKKNEEAKDVVLKLKYSKDRKNNSYGADKFKFLVRKAGTKLDNNEVTLASNIAKLDVTLKKIKQTGSLSLINGGGVESVSNTEAVINFIEGEEKEATFNYKITAYQSFDKKPKLIISTKVENVTVKVDSFEKAGDGSATAVVRVKVGKKAKGTLNQAIKISAEGADELTPNIKLTGSAPSED